MVVHKNSLGLVLGIACGGWHLIWQILVATKLAKPFFDAILTMHNIKLTYTIAPFNFTNAAALVAVTFILAYVVGWLVAALWNSLAKKK